MKHIYLFLFPVIVLLSCQKEIKQQEQDRFVLTVRSCLQDSLTAGDFSDLDLDRAVLSKVDSVELYLLRIPFRSKKIQNDFVLLETSKNGEVHKGRIVHLEGGQKVTNVGGIKKRLWEGSITITSLKRKLLLNSEITNGFIEAFHPQANIRTETVVPQDNVLPEVIVVAYVNYNEGISYSDWLYLESLFYTSPFDYSGGGGGGGGAYYGSTDGSGGAYYEGSGTYVGSGSTDPVLLVQIDPLILIDYEWQADNEAIEIEKYLKCFDKIPDAGASCSIEIFTDIPVDSDPNKLFNVQTQSPGHTFLQIKKSNGTQSVIQNLGFYPKANFKAVLTNAPIDGKFVDNGFHEFNASLKMMVNSMDFKSILAEIRYLSRFIKYDIDEYNCTDFSLDVFNKVRVNKLQIPMYDIPGGVTAAGTRTPQGLYNKLKQMKSENNAEASNINIEFTKSWVASSDGPCQ